MAHVGEITIERSMRRTISLHIEQDGTILIKAPRFISQGEIDSFIAKHQSWIDKRLTLIKKRLENKRKDDEYLYLGKTLTLTVGDYKEISVKGNQLLFPVGLMFRKEKEVASWYKKKASDIITKQVEEYALKMGASYKDISFSDTRSQWGRCTHDNRLQFSWRLVMAPLLVLNYVVIHELSHTFQKNHTQLFWMKVRNYNPSYRQQIKWLKDHGPLLHE